MTTPRGRPPKEQPKDMLLIWTDRCCNLRMLETNGKDCLTCPHHADCEKEADRRISRKINRQFTTKKALEIRAKL